MVAEATVAPNKLDNVVTDVTTEQANTLDLQNSTYVFLNGTESSIQMNTTTIAITNGSISDDSIITVSQSNNTVDKIENTTLLEHKHTEISTVPLQPTTDGTKAINASFISGLTHNSINSLDISSTTSIFQSLLTTSITSNNKMEDNNSSAATTKPVENSLTTEKQIYSNPNLQNITHHTIVFETTLDNVKTDATTITNDVTEVDPNSQVKLTTHIGDLSMSSILDEEISTKVTDYLEQYKTTVNGIQNSSDITLITLPQDLSSGNNVNQNTLIQGNENTGNYLVSVSQTNDKNITLATNLLNEVSNLTTNSFVSNHTNTNEQKISSTVNEVGQINVSSISSALGEKSEFYSTAANPDTTAYNNNNSITNVNAITSNAQQSSTGLSNVFSSEISTSTIVNDVLIYTTVASESLNELTTLYQLNTINITNDVNTTSDSSNGNKQSTTLPEETLTIRNIKLTASSIQTSTEFALSTTFEDHQIVNQTVSNVENINTNSTQLLLTTKSNNDTSSLVVTTVDVIASTTDTSFITETEKNFTNSITSNAAVNHTNEFGIATIESNTTEYNENYTTLGKNDVGNSLDQSSVTTIISSDISVNLMSTATVIEGLIVDKTPITLYYDQVSKDLSIDAIESSVTIPKLTVLNNTPSGTNIQVLTNSASLASTEANGITTNINQNTVTPSHVLVYTNTSSANLLGNYTAYETSSLYDELTSKVIENVTYFTTITPASESTYNYTNIKHSSNIENTIGSENTSGIELTQNLNSDITIASYNFTKTDILSQTKNTTTIPGQTITTSNSDIIDYSTRSSDIDSGNTLLSLTQLTTDVPTTSVVQHDVSNVYTSTAFFETTQSPNGNVDIMHDTSTSIKEPAVFTNNSSLLSTNINPNDQRVSTIAAGIVVEIDNNVSTSYLTTTEIIDLNINSTTYSNDHANMSNQSSNDRNTIIYLETSSTSLYSSNTNKIKDEEVTDTSYSVETTPTTKIHPATATVENNVTVNGSHTYTGIPIFNITVDNIVIDLSTTSTLEEYVASSSLKTSQRIDNSVTNATRSWNVDADSPKLSQVSYTTLASSANDDSQLTTVVMSIDTMTISSSNISNFHISQPDKFKSTTVTGSTITKAKTQADSNSTNTYTNFTNSAIIDTEATTILIGLAEQNDSIDNQSINSSVNVVTLNKTTLGNKNKSINGVHSTEHATTVLVSQDNISHNLNNNNIASLPHEHAIVSSAITEKTMNENAIETTIKSVGELESKSPSLLTTTVTLNDQDIFTTVITSATKGKLYNSKYSTSKIEENNNTIINVPYDSTIVVQDHNQANGQKSSSSYDQPTFNNHVTIPLENTVGISEPEHVEVIGTTISSNVSKIEKNITLHMPDTAIMDDQNTNRSLSKEIETTSKVPIVTVFMGIDRTTVKIDQIGTEFSPSTKSNEYVTANVGDRNNLMVSISPTETSSTQPPQATNGFSNVITTSVGEPDFTAHILITNTKNVNDFIKSTTVVAAISNLEQNNSLFELIVTEKSSQDNASTPKSDTATLAQSSATVNTLNTTNTVNQLNSIANSTEQLGPIQAISVTENIAHDTIATSVKSFETNTLSSNQYTTIDKQKLASLSDEKLTQSVTNSFVNAITTSVGELDFETHTLVTKTKNVNDFIKSTAVITAISYLERNNSLFEPTVTEKLTQDNASTLKSDTATYTQSIAAINTVNITNTVPQSNNISNSTEHLGPIQALSDTENIVPDSIATSVKSFETNTPSSNQYVTTDKLTLTSLSDERLTQSVTISNASNNTTTNYGQSNTEGKTVHSTNLYMTSQSSKNVDNSSIQSSEITVNNAVNFSSTLTGGMEFTAKPVINVHNQTTFNIDITLTNVTEVNSSTPIVYTDKDESLINFSIDSSYTSTVSLVYTSENIHDTTYVAVKSTVDPNLMLTSEISEYSIVSENVVSQVPSSLVSVLETAYPPNLQNISVQDIKNITHAESVATGTITSSSESTATSSSKLQSSSLKNEQNTLITSESHLHLESSIIQTTQTETQHAIPLHIISTKKNSDYDMNTNYDQGIISSTPLTTILHDQPNNIGSTALTGNNFTHNNIDITSTNQNTEFPSSMKNYTIVTAFSNVDIATTTQSSYSTSIKTTTQNVSSLTTTSVGDNAVILVTPPHSPTVTDDFVLIEVTNSSTDSIPIENVISYATTNQIVSSSSDGGKLSSISMPNTKEKITEIPYSNVVPENSLGHTTYSTEKPTDYTHTTHENIKETTVVVLNPASTSISTSTKQPTTRNANLTTHLNNKEHSPLISTIDYSSESTIRSSAYEHYPTVNDAGSITYSSKQTVHPKVFTSDNKLVASTGLIDGDITTSLSSLPEIVHTSTSESSLTDTSAFKSTTVKSIISLLAKTSSESHTIGPTTEKPSTSFKCPGWGRFPDPDDCTIYYVCTFWSTPLLINCQLNAAYDPKLSRCTTDRTNCLRDGFKCSAVGRFDDPNSCTSYYMCVQNYSGTFDKFKLFCIPFHYFDQKSQSCVRGQCPSKHYIKSKYGDIKNKGNDFLLDFHTYIAKEHKRISKSNDESDDNDNNTQEENDEENNNNIYFDEDKYEKIKKKIFNKIKEDEDDEGKNKNKSKDIKYDDKTKESEEVRHEDSSGENFECKTEGLFPDSTDCTKYYKCKKKDGEILKKPQQCKRDKIFNEFARRCVLGDSSECNSK